MALLRDVTTFEDVRFDAGSLEIVAAIPSPARLLRAA
jgi:hypothetical protein